METENLPEDLAIPSDLLADIQAEAAARHRPPSDVLRDVIERGLRERRREAHAATELEHARVQGLLDNGDDRPMTDDYRRVIREKISQGVRSLREGRVSDGASFMARMDAELAELERQGR